MSRGRAEIGALGLAGRSPLCREAIRPHRFWSDGGRDGAESLSAAVDARRWYRLSEPYGRTREGNPEGEGACLVYMTAERGLGPIALPPACFNA